MDYYKLKNIQADTDMRNSIGGETSAPKVDSKTAPGK
jgi:uncharacterized protein YqfA (UPF0365 family)